MTQITLAIAKDHLRIESDDETHDDRIQRSLTQAEAIVIDYLKADEDAYGGAGSNDFPDEVAAAVFLVMTNLFETPQEDPLTPGVKNLLHRHRDPALA